MLLYPRLMKLTSLLDGGLTTKKQCLLFSWQLFRCCKMSLGVGMFVYALCWYVWLCILFMYNFVMDLHVEKI